MTTALVTGASSGIGLAIAKRLIKLKYKVYGLARDFHQCNLMHNRFIQTECDITSSVQLKQFAKNLENRGEKISLLINNAGIGYFGPHETISPDKIEQMVKTNLTAPMILTNLLFKQLKNSQGTIINIASTAGLYPKRFGSAYGATKAGLINFGESLFDECRKQGIKVTTICPDMTFRTSFYNDAPFEPAHDDNSHIMPSCIADAVENSLNTRGGTVISQMVIMPQKVGLNKHKRKQGKALKS
jgi:short-subunit dehydrogenase